MLFPHLDSDSRRVRGKAFAHAAANAAQQPHRAGPMAVYYRLQYRNVYDVRKQWERAFAGATLVDRVRSKLYGSFPELQQVFNNPLWALLSESAAPLDWDDLAGTIRIAGQPLDGLGGRLTERLCDRVDWPCFCVHLVLLRTHQECFAHHRHWLAKNFLRIYAWVSVQTPLLPVCQAVHCLLERPVRDLLLQYPGECPWSDWSSLHALYYGFLERCMQRGWLSAHDQQLALLLWNLSPLHRKAVMDTLYSEGASLPLATRMPALVQQAWRRQRRRWLDHPIVLNGYSCDFPQVERMATVADAQVNRGSCGSSELSVNKSRGG